MFAAPNEIDFVLPRNREAVNVIECKWNPDTPDAAALTLFRSYYPKGRNFLVTPLEGPDYRKRLGKLEVTVCGLDGLES